MGLCVWAFLRPSASHRCYRIRRIPLFEVVSLYEWGDFSFYVLT